MTSTSPERKPTSEIVVAVTAVIVALLPVPLLILYLRNLLAGDPPAYAWVATVGASLLIAVAGSVMLGLSLWDPRNPRRECGDLDSQRW